MPEATQEVDIDVTCPKCGHTHTVTEDVTVEWDWSDYAPDYP